jgi:hypothetical protein
MDKLVASLAAAHSFEAVSLLITVAGLIFSVLALKVAKQALRAAKE